ncbi:unnamed protein product [Triticum turgidum subsp. durum]|uniref:MULE transposase domain-containing protein n=1 Tax=Triticum turgidum subsp. durum TaxID=4567 RepID=A0A9R1S092_TRITD|nr:unnamed protein product [Triticum turgidum subsp. durum]
MYAVCMGVFGSETNENWIWFMQMVRQAIGSPRGLTICIDAGQPVMTGVKEVFPEAEHRECMFHLVSNFKKKFYGKVFDDHLWAAAYSWNPYIFEKNWAAMDLAKPTATAYLRRWHTRLWSRSQFSTICKVDYVTNNLAECFNNWIKHHKSLNLDDFFDKVRKMIMIMWNRRRKVARKLVGLILPHIIKKAAYDQLIPAMVDKNQWPKSDHGFFMFPPLLKSTAGRHKTERYKGCSEKKRKSGQHLCPICKDYGHHWHKCKKGNPDDIAAILAVRGRPKKRAKTTKASIVPCEDDAPAASMCFPPSQSLEPTTTKKRKHDNSITGASKSQMLEKTTKEKGKGSKSGSGVAKRSRTQPICVANKKASVALKLHAKRKSKEVADKLPHLPMVPHDSPTMGTRSKKMNPASPAMSTRSKRRLCL